MNKASDDTASDDTSPNAIADLATGTTLISRSIDSLVEQGWAQQDDFLPAPLSAALAAECLALTERGQLKFAGVGRGAAQQLRPDIRGDRIQWLKHGQSPACDEYLALMDSLRTALNQSLYLGLEEYESHFAYYPTGAFYQKHLDRFRDDDRRTVSVVIYLNADWQAADGGALRLHPQDKPTEDILPLAGRMAMFMSADLLHEVLPATRDRMSIAGWFRRRAN
ncbi:2OG-Fe(II) oxygenase [Pigmentiphaga aceris]|uniref:2OG-Fe(II) oxygenase n=2 Tax=Pigmentiphaga aceris TaxID=1940612 RepID=A0A5C0B5Q3_9BURK|nr:2OG-Fe(II) oxygenase [Pigmentiphaga aceris]